MDEIIAMAPSIGRGIHQMGNQMTLKERRALLQRRTVYYVYEGLLWSCRAWGLPRLHQTIKSGSGPGWSPFYFQISEKVGKPVFSATLRVSFPLAC
jgi:hypothetical protein